MDKHKLLFIDDEESILKSMKRIFRSEGYEIYTVNRGIDGVKLLDKHEFSLIVSDYRMPEMNGVEFLKIAKEKYPDIIRIILTGYADVNAAISAINEGEIYKYIKKPWEDKDLKILIKRAIEHYELIREREGLLEKIKNQNEELKGWNKNLGKKVEEKTMELKEAYEELQLKVKELKGRDKIFQYILTLHTFEDTLDFILGIILDVVRFEKIVIYVVNKEKKAMYPKIGCEMKDNKKSNFDDEITEFPTLPIPRLEKNDESLLVGEFYIDKVSEYSYFIPVKKDNIFLGAILVDNSKTKKMIYKDDLKTLTGFASFVALAVNDYLVTSNMPDLQAKIGDILGELEQI